MKLYTAHLDFLQKLTPDERRKELETAQEEIKAFVLFLRELAEDTSNPEDYRDLLDLITAYSAYGLELVAEKAGVEIAETPARAYTEALEIVADNEGQLPS